MFLFLPGSTLYNSAGKWTAFYFSFAVGVCMLLCGFSVRALVCVFATISLVVIAVQQTEKALLMDGFQRFALRAALSAHLEYFYQHWWKRLEGFFLTSHKHCCPCACQTTAKRLDSCYSF